MAVNAGGISDSDRTGALECHTQEAPRRPVSRKPRMPAGLAGFHSTATRVARGNDCDEQLQPLAGELG